MTSSDSQSTAKNAIASMKVVGLLIDDKGPRPVFLTTLIDEAREYFVAQQINDD